MCKIVLKFNLKNPGDRVLLYELRISAPSVGIKENLYILHLACFYGDIIFVSYLIFLTLKIFHIHFSSGFTYKSTHVLIRALPNSRITVKIVDHTIHDACIKVLNLI